MNRFIIAALLCTACGVPSAPTPETQEGTVSVASGVQADCPDPADPNVHYMAKTQSKCAALLFQCAPTQTTFDDECGCGCIGPAPTPACPAPTNSTVHYVSQDPLTCTAILFECRSNQTTFFDSCGCGCID